MPKIIPAMHAMGYKADPDGVCFGLAAMGAQAVIRKDAQSFARRIALIHNSGDTFPKTVKKEKQIELQCFFDELSIYQGPDNHSEFSSIFPKLQQDIANLELLTPKRELISLSLLKENEKTLIALPKIKAEFANNFTFDEFVVFVQKTASFLNGEPFSLLVSEPADNHTIQLGFDGTKWLLTNHDEVEICNNTTTNIQYLIRKLFEIKSSAYKEQKTFSIKIVLNHFSQTNLDRLENHDFDINLLTCEFDKNILFELMLAFQYSNKIALLNILIDKIKLIDPSFALFVQALEFKDCYGQSALFRAATNEQSEILNLLIEEIENAQVSEITKADLFSVKDDMGISSFYYAVSGGYINIAHALLQAMNKMQLHAQKRDVISLQDLNGTSAIHMAVLDGHTKLVELLLNAINELGICEREKFNLITVKTCEKESVLHMAAEKGHLDIIKLLLSTVRQKRVPEKDKLAWITSSTSFENNALYIAARGGRVAIAKQLFKAIDDCDVDVNIKEKHKKNLLDSKDEKGITAAIIAAIYDHVEFYRYILAMYKQLHGDSIDTVLNLLTQKQIDGASAIYLAAEHGCEEMFDFFIETIMALDIDELNKALLIEAKRDDGACALSLAAQQGYTSVVKKMLRTMLSMNISESEKFRLLDARNEKNASALLLAVDKGDITTVKVLVDLILSSNLPVEAKTMLLTSAAPDFNLKSAYQHAVNKKYKQIADYLKAAMKNATNEESALGITTKRSFAGMDGSVDIDYKKRHKGQDKKVMFALADSN